MNQFGDLYAQYYDLLYKDKDYEGEVNYIDKLIKDNTSNCKTILDMGCGTGKHAVLLSEKNYLVDGVDLSKEMLAIAETRRHGREDKLQFHHAKIQDINLNKKFDAVISLFHVMSYQNTNNDLIESFKSAKEHLIKGGVFIFDFWYGPAVLTDLPSVRVKRLENEKIKITRIAEPTLHHQYSVVDVAYDIFIEEKSTKQLIQKQELHKMRYFFDAELELICTQLGLVVKNKYEWMRDKSPSINSWSVVWVIEN